MVWSRVHDIVEKLCCGFDYSDCKKWNGLYATFIIIVVQCADFFLMRMELSEWKETKDGTVVGIIPP